MSRARRGPLVILDEALALVHRGGLKLALRVALASAPLSALALLLYYMEAVEGLRVLRFAFVPAIVIAWWWRAYALREPSRVYTELRWGGLGKAQRDVDFSDAARLASPAGLLLLMWLFVPALAGWMGLGSAIFASLTLVCLAIIAPSWSVRSGVGEQEGGRAFLAAMGDSGGQRFAAATSAFLMQFGMLIVFGNALAALTILGMIGRSALGFDPVFFEQFFSTQNAFVVIAIGILVVLLFEPLRLSLAATIYVGGRVLTQGLDIEALIKRVSARRSGLALALALLSVASPSAAQSRLSDAADNEASQLAERALSADEYREFEDRRHLEVGPQFDELMKRAFKAMAEAIDELRDLMPDTMPNGFTIPPGVLFGIGAGLGVLLFSIFVVMGLRARRSKDDVIPPPVGATEDPRDLPPEEHIDRAAALAAQGLHREALRALYLASLVALDRARLIEFEPSRTNWHYLRDMPRSGPRALFEEFNEIFDRKWYGEIPATEADYKRCSQLAKGLSDATRTNAEAAA